MAQIREFESTTESYFILDGVSYPKVYEAMLDNSYSDTKVKLVPTNRDTNQLVFSTEYTNIRVDDESFDTALEAISRLNQVVFSKGGGSGGGGTIQSIQSGSSNVTINNTDVNNPQVIVKNTIEVFIPVTMAQIESTEADTILERKEKLSTWINLQNYNKPSGEIWYWDIVDEPDYSSGGTSDGLWIETEDGEFTVEDEFGNIGFRISNDGYVEIPRFTDETKTTITDFVTDGIIIPENDNSINQIPSLDNYADINHIINYGQSLSVGQTEVVLTTSALFPNLVNFDGVTRTSPYDKSLTGDTYPTNRRIALTPIIERVSDGAPATGTLRETPTSGILESLALEINKFSATTFPTLPIKLLGSALVVLPI